VQLLRDIGASVSPFNSFMFLQGLETLSLRMERHVSNAEAVAKHLEGHPQVEWIQYAGLESSPYNERAKQYMPKGAGSVLAFGIVGGEKAGQKFVESMDLHSHVANIGDVRSLAIHPASTTHSQLSPEEQTATGVAPNMVRLSVGIETIADILADLEVGFAATAAL
jgi:O-acetylhomoserine (thiol)-lyase